MKEEMFIVRAPKRRGHAMPGRATQGSAGELVSGGRRSTGERGPEPLLWCPRERWDVAGSATEHV